MEEYINMVLVLIAATIVGIYIWTLLPTINQ